MGAVPNMFMFDCGRCDKNEIKQPTEPVLRYIMNGRGGGASVQCCTQCVRELDNEAKIEYEKKKAIREAVEEEERAKIRAEEEARIAAAGATGDAVSDAPKL